MTCRKEEGGQIKCGLGLGCQNVEMRGKSLSEIIKSRKSWTPYADNKNRDFDLVVVLGSPGYKDDWNKGIGFDPSYNKLIELITGAGFSPDKVFVCNIVRCCPQKGRRPSVQEIITCKDYTKHDLQRVNPKVVMLLGSIPLRLFNLHAKGGVNRIRGQEFILPLPGEEKEYKIVISVDPASLIYATDPRVESRVQDDYKKAFAITQGKKYILPKFNPTYTLIDTFEKAEDFVNKAREQKFFSFDTESRSLPWFREPLMCMSFSLGKDNNYIFPLYNHDPDGADWKLKPFGEAIAKVIAQKYIKPLFEDPEIPKGVFNHSYDYLVLRKHLGINTQGFIYDGMLFSHLLDENSSNTLEFCADVEFKVGNYSKELHDIIGVGKDLKKTYDYVPDEILWKYAAGDAECTYRLIKLYLKRLQKKPHLWKLYCVETEPLIHTLADAQWNGHPIDSNILKSLIKEYSEEAEKQLDIIQQQTWPEFNPNSSLDVVKALRQAGFTAELRDTSKVTGFSANKVVLLKLKESGSKLAGDLLEFRKLAKISGTYLNDATKNVDVDGRMRHGYLIHGTSTGRLSSRFLHQLPRTDQKRKEEGKYNIRDMLIPLPGCKIVYADFSQIELRVPAVLSGDKEMLKVFESGQSVHKETAMTVLGLPLEIIEKYKPNYTLGKNINFSIIYGGEGDRIVKTNTWVDKNGVEKVLDFPKYIAGMAAFKERFHVLMTWLESIPEITRAQEGIYITPFGRERRMGAKIFDKREGLRKAAEREVTNFSIQSPAAAVTIRTLNIIHKFIKDWRKGGLNPEDLYLLNTVHDSMAYNVKNEKAEWFAGILRQTAERNIPELNDYSFKINIGIGNSLSEAEENAE